MESMGLIVGTRVRQNILRKIKEKGASSRETAIHPDEFNFSWIEKRHLKKLQKLEKVLETDDGRIYVLCTDGKHC
jgi:hypothetical protein